MITNRRALLIGSRLSLVLALALIGASAAQPAEPPPLQVGDQWNHGDDPWDSHPGGYVFKPARVGIIYIELLDNFRIKASRFHYSIEQQADKSWDASRATAVKVINWLNSNRDTDPPVIFTCEEDGLNQLVFGQPHHVVVYIKNENIKYPPRPIWFGNTLQGTVQSTDKTPFVGRARENHSFFKAEVLTLTPEETAKGTESVSNQFIYFQNHFHKHGLLTGHDPIKEGEIRVYSMKIALLSQSIVGDIVESEVPIIIDPDTGNLGGGHPMVDKKKCPKP